MTLFSEIYGAYYEAVGEIIRAAQNGALDDDTLRRICTDCAFPESYLTIESALKEQRWQLLRRDGTTPIRHTPKLPVTLLEKRWIKAILEDPRVKLFGISPVGLEDVTPLFRQDDIVIYDSYADRDPYENREYIANFRLILDAIRTRTPLKLMYRSPKNQRDIPFLLMPDNLEYSEKDDKFRLIASRQNGPITINLARIVSVKHAPDGNFHPAPKQTTEKLYFTMLLTDERNALDRVLLHFAHFEKRAERITETKYRITVYYDRWDESELVIRVLSFGPMVKVTAPSKFLALIRNKLADQYNLMHHRVECEPVTEE